MIARKIEQVDEPDRRLLLAASVQGHEFDSAIAGQALPMDPAEVEDRLDRLERVHVFVSRVGEHELSRPHVDAASTGSSTCCTRTCCSPRCSRRGGSR